MSRPLLALIITMALQVGGVGMAAHATLAAAAAPTVEGYNGLVREVTSGRYVPAGALSAAIQPHGALSARLVFDGGSHSITGKLGSDGVVRFGRNALDYVKISRRGKPSLIVSMSRDLASSAPLMAFIWVDDSGGGTHVATAVADHNGFDAKNLVPAEYLGPRNATGQYTAMMTYSGSQAVSFPLSAQTVGFSFANMTVTRTGTVTYIGVMADGGTPVLMSAPLTESLSCSLFARLYGNKGFLSALLQCDASQKESDIHSLEVVWSRPAQSKGWFAEGWADGLYLDLAAARYIATPRRSVIPAPDDYYGYDADDRGDLIETPWSQSVLAIYGYNMTNLRLDVKISSADRGVVLTPGYGASLGINRGTGRIGGAFNHPDYGTRAGYQGIVYQKGTVPGAYGFFKTAKPSPNDPNGGFGTVILLPPLELDTTAGTSSTSGATVSGGSLTLASSNSNVGTTTLGAAALTLSVGTSLQLSGSNNLSTTGGTLTFSNSSIIQASVADVAVGITPSLTINSSNLAIGVATSLSPTIGGFGLVINSGTVNTGSLSTLLTTNSGPLTINSGATLRIGALTPDLFVISSTEANGVLNIAPGVIVLNGSGAPINTNGGTLYFNSGTTSTGSTTGVLTTLQIGGTGTLILGTPPSTTTTPVE